MNASAIDLTSLLKATALLQLGVAVLNLFLVRLFNWREDLLPRYKAAVAAAEGHVETLAVAELPALVDELADLAGEYFTSIAALAGAGYKMEINLARFYRRPSS